jgi:hypothetical protein
VADRGRAFADRYVANPNSAVAPSWTDAINSVTGGSDCSFGGGNHDSWMRCTSRFQSGLTRRTPSGPTRARRGSRCATHVMMRLGRVR